MNLSEYSGFDALGLADLVRRKEIRPRKLAELALAAVQQLNPKLNFLVESFAERAERAPEKIAGPLGGVPFFAKDLPFEKGVLAELGSELCAGYRCPFDTELALRLRAAGAVNMGRTTTPELALVAATENRVTGQTRNPWRPDRSVAGSSGGAAASVACGAVPFAQGTDGGGSIRMPSSFCGVVGLKPTRARVPLAPMSTLAYAGLNVTFVLTRSVRDCAAILDAVEGPAIGDAVQIPRPEEAYLSTIEVPSKRLRIAFTADAWSGVPVEGEVAAALARTATLCEELGHVVEEAAPGFDYQTYIGAQKTLWYAFVHYDITELARGLKRQPSTDNLQSTTWDVYRRGQALRGEEVVAALETYSEVARGIGTFFETYDMLLTPTCTITPGPLGAFDPGRADADADDVFDHLAPHETFTALFNATGQPAISLPLEESSEGMPIGLQFAGGFGREGSLLQLAAELERARPWRGRLPQIHASKR